MTDLASENVSALVDKSARHGMKIVGRRNWLSPDAVTLFTAGGPLDDEAGLMWLVSTGNYLAERFGEFEVDATVNEEVVRLFHVGRATIVYGVFFYPLFDVGFEKAFAAVELATKEACEAHGMPKKSRKNQAARTDWLCEFGWIDKSSCEHIHDMRWLRNHAVHDRQNIIGLGSVSRLMHDAKTLLERLAAVRDARVPNDPPNPPHDHRARPRH